MRDPDSAVIDTCVLLAGLLSPTGASYRLLSLLGTGAYRPVVTVPLLLEYESVASRHLTRAGLTEGDLGDFLDYLCSVAILQRVHYLWRPHLRDAQDDHVLEAALSGQARTIVTFNLRDFREAPELGVEPLRPRDYLHLLGVAHEHP